MNVTNREALGFERATEVAFSFLFDRGFQVVHIEPTQVIFRKGSVEVDVFHGRQSYEVGAGVSAHGHRYTISEILRLAEPDTFRDFLYSVATTYEGLATAVNDIGALLQKYGRSALNGDAAYFEKLKQQRNTWSRDYADEVLVAKLRPMANKAFHDGDYAAAVELYGKIQNSLSPADQAKFKLARRRTKEK